MRIYSVSGSKLTEIREERIKLERQIQRLTEENLELIFSLEHVRSEFYLHDYRIDTLAFDRDARAFVIIEYKKDKKVRLEQGMTYYNLMLNNQADFILEYRDRSTRTLRKKDVQWEQSRVIFIAPEFTKPQQTAIRFNDRIQLYEAHMYNHSLLVFN